MPKRESSAAVSRHFVTFYSPGTFFHEESERSIDSWDTAAATAMARSIVERHGATPFCFVFSTRSRGPADLDSRVTARSGRFYLGGRVETLAEVAARNDPKESILLSNMRGNGWDRIIINENSWRVVQPLEPGDTILPFDPEAGP